MVAHEMGAGRGDHRRDPLDQLERVEHDVGRAVAPAVLETVEQTTVGKRREALGRDGRSGDVAAEALESPTVPRGNGDVGVHAHAADVGATLGGRFARRVPGSELCAEPRGCGCERKGGAT